MGTNKASAHYYHDQAERIREMAKGFRFPEMRVQLEKIAVQFDYLAVTREERERAFPPTIYGALAGDRAKSPRA